MATFATSSQFHQEKYDVFISFRGAEIRDGFLSHLTKRLRQEGVYVYVDEMLEAGDEISPALLEAIERSIIAMVIFSKDYASSRWCLEELVKIMECKRVNNQIVIPVFYKVDPSHVRHQEGSYAVSFTQHEQKFKDELKKLQIWRFLLKETANLSGYHSSNFLNESDLIDGIIKDVLKKLEDKCPIKLMSLIGFEKNLAFIESFMKVDLQEVGILGIWGKGGIGKTTLAHAIFEKVSHQFDRSCFVSNVREESKKIGLTSLLEKILCVLLDDQHLTMKARAYTQRRLRQIKVLLVLDDVDTSSQLRYLIKENLSLGPRSKVIITSRDRHVLVSGGVHMVHGVKELNMEDSLQLFCRHAFKQDHPKMGYEKLSAQAIQYAGGLPLALKVLGSYLTSRDTTTWDSTLKRLRKYPNVEIQTVLRVSYDGLDIPEKRIFLDIAFFFRGEKIDDIRRVLDACDGFYVDCGIDSLRDKALINISRDNKVEIHDLLQEMAEEIVREESIENPERRSRLNDEREILDVLKNNKGTDAIEGIILDIKRTLDLSANTFQRMRNLRFLKIKTDMMKVDLNFGDPLHLPEGLDSIPNKLSYFCWESYPLESLPLGICPEKLVEIHLERSKIKKLWDGVQDLMNLKIIDLNRSRELKELPDFSMAQNLEIVDLQYCENLCTIHPSIISLPKLVSLNLRACSKLNNLYGDNHLKSLKHLTLSRCYRLKEFLLSSEEMTSLDLADTGIETLKLPIGRFNKLKELYLGEPLRSFQINELGSLTSLKKFSLSNFRERIDKSILAIMFDAWCSLEELRLRRCAVPEIPDNISALSLLKTLSLRGCGVESLPNSIKHLSQLKHIDLGGCKRLRSVPELPPSITGFYVDECKSVETIHFSVGRAICNNNAGEIKVCYPGSTIPKGFKYSQTGVNSITIELAPSSFDPFLGLASCCILPPWEGNTSVGAPVCRKFHFEDEEINYKDEQEFPRRLILNRDHVFVWYDPMERILEETQRRRFDKGTTSKFACEFFIGYSLPSGVVKLDIPIIKACGIWPIYASDLKEEIVEEMELKLENHRTETERLESVTGNTRGPSAEENHQTAAGVSFRRGTSVRQRTWNLSCMTCFLRVKNSPNKSTAPDDDNLRNA